MNSSLRLQIIGSLAAGLLAVAGGVLAARSPGLATTGLTIAAGVGIFLILRKLHSGVAIWSAAVLIGTGGLFLQVTGFSAALPLVACVAALVPRTPPRRGLALTFWVLALLLLVGGLLITGSAGATLPLPRLATFGAVITATFLAFVNDDSRRAASLLLQRAGILASVGVFVSFVLGRPLIAVSEFSLRYVSSGTSGASRASGFGSAPNETAMLLGAAVIAIVVRFLFDRAESNGDTARRLVLIALIGGALILTGSRSAIIGTLLAVAVLLLAVQRGTLGRRVLLILVAVATAGLAAFTGLFAERSLNIFSGTDGSLVYRRSVQDELWARVSLDQVAGFGFASGNTIAPNEITAGVNNIDNAWLYMWFSTGSLVTMGLIGILIAAVLISWRNVGIRALAAVPYIGIVTFAENAWAITGPAVCLSLLISSVALKGRELENDSNPRREHVVAGRRYDESSSLG